MIHYTHVRAIDNDYVAKGHRQS